jgi:DNA-binding CsgD family transcriptional regulator
VSEPCPHCGFDIGDDVRDVKIYASLSPTQKKLLNLVITGMHPKDISKVFGVSYSALRSYLHIVFVKTGMDNRRSLIRFVISRPTLLKLVKEL